MRGRYETHVYAARGNGCMKVGVSKNVKARMHGLQRHEGGPFHLVKSWEHRDPRAVEAMVKGRNHIWRVYGYESFAIDEEKMVADIEFAISLYDRLGMTRESPILTWMMAGEWQCALADDALKQYAAAR